MDMAHAGRWVAAVLLAACLLAACASPSPSPYPGEPAGPSTSNDPALAAAAEAIEPILRTSFPDSYVGLVLDHGHRTLIVYRRPNPALDAVARRHATAVQVVIRDAKYSLRQMQDLAERVMNDAGYWRGRGIVINGAGPASDGSGVDVMTASGTADEQQALSRRYGEGSVKVVQGGAIPPIGATPWRPSLSPTAPGR